MMNDPNNFCEMPDHQLYPKQSKVKEVKKQKQKQNKQTNKKNKRG